MKACLSHLPRDNFRACFVFLMVVLGIAPAHSVRAFDCADPSDDFAEILCENPELLDKHTALQALSLNWQNGPNVDLNAEFSGEPPAWEGEARACLDARDETACLEEFYDQRLAKYSQVSVEFVEKEENDIRFLGLIGMSARTRDEVYIDARIEGDGFEAHDLTGYEAGVKTPYDLEGDLTDCASCFRQSYLQLEEGFRDERLLIVNQFQSLYEGGAHPTYAFETPIYDVITKEEIGFSGLFLEEDWSAVKSDVAEQIVAELEQLEKARQATDGDDEVLYFPNIGEQLLKLPDEDWNRIAFFPDIVDGKILGFRVQADDFEFAPHAYGSYYTDLIIPVSNVMMDAIKDEYLPSFSIL